VSIEKGVLYIVATPIGNLGDMSHRASEILNDVDLIAAEDTRHSRPLLRHFGIGTPLLALHEHNERDIKDQIVKRLQQGESVALISDAGTPLISDPGYTLVHECHRLGVTVTPVPGPSAAIAALSASGLPTDRFLFEGFLQRSHKARVEQLQALREEQRTLVFYESSHRIKDSLKDMAQVFGSGRPAVLARELTKLYETILSCPLGKLGEILDRDPNQSKGEFVVLIAGAEERTEEQLAPEAERVIRILLEELPVKQAAALAARISGEKKNRLYQFALAVKGPE
jgi:16S rRNA (cytidine1402-2'-O)-methyltransferase